MLVTDNRLKLLVFVKQKGWSQRKTAHEMGYSREHFNRMINNYYPENTSFNDRIELLFLRYQYYAGLYFDEQERRWKL